MSSILFEIVELPNGDIALQRANEQGEPLVCVRFSDESLYFLQENKAEVAKAMIEAGLERAGELAAEGDDDLMIEADSRVVH